MEEITFSSLFKGLRTPDKILLAVFGGLAAVEDVLDSLPTPRSITRSLYTTAPPPLRGIPEYSFRRAFMRLLESKYLERVEEGTRIRFQLTEEGLTRLYNKIPEIKLKERKFDGSFRVVVYDVVEVERRLRRSLRSGLKKLGFIYLQKSVWISPYSWEEELENLFQKLKAGNRVLICKAVFSPFQTTRLLKSYWPDLLP